MLSNDPNKSSISLLFKGSVSKFAEISPQRVRLLGTEGETLEQKVRIAPTAAYPFKILSASPADPEKIAVSYKEVPGKNGPEYELTITNVSQAEGRYFGYINIGTNSTVRKELKIYVSMYVRKKS